MSSLLEKPAQVIRFGLFEVDLVRNELRRKGLRLKLQDQPLSVLRILLEQPGTLVTRGEMRTRLWDPHTFVDFDHSLNSAVARLREVLGDQSENPRFVETVPRKGYRFIAPVQFQEEEKHASDLKTLPPTEAQSAMESVTRPVVIASEPYVSAPLPDLPRGLPRWRRRTLAAAVVAVCLVAALVFISLRRRGSGSSDSPQITSIAVLPMENLSGVSNEDYFANGMTDELIASLAQISSLRVVSHTKAMDYKGSHASLEQIAHDLHVDAIVEGTVLRDGDRVRITAELVQISTDRHIWADTFESRLGDVLTVQNQVASAIVSQIRIKLTASDKRTLASAKAMDPEALEDYLKGRFYWAKRSEDALGRAIKYFQAATEKDPNYALAYAGLADSYGILGSATIGTVPISEVAPKAEAAARKAVALDPTLAETQTALATVEFNDNWNWVAAESGFRRAIESNPNYSTAHQRYSLYLSAMGRTDQSLSEMSRAIALDPLSPSMNFSLGWRLYLARRYDEAILQLRNTLEMEPSYVLAHIILGQCYEQKGRYPEAIEELLKANTLAPHSPPVLAALGNIYAVAGKKNEALKLLDELKFRSSSAYVSPFYLALICTGLGDREQAFTWLDESYNDRSNNTIFLNVTPQFDTLRSDPRFERLRRRVGV